MEDKNIENDFLTRGFVKDPVSQDTQCGKCTCAKLSVFDWLSNNPPAQTTQKQNIYEVRFKNTSKGFYRTTEDLKLKVGDIVAVETTQGHDVGIVSAIGTVAMLQLYKKGLTPDSDSIRRIYRKARFNDMEKWIAAVRKERETIDKTKAIIAFQNLDMKLNDVEYQGDGTKATFYYTAEDRVDFRELIKVLADTFKVRIEMKQIGIRQEASRLGGVGSCGRELCCSTWITKFCSVTTSSARVQQLSLNPVKLAGQCGKLKCCLNYEYDTYLDALKEFPDSNTTLKTEVGNASHVKSDVFRKLMWYSYNNSKDNSMMAIHIDQVKEIIEMNKKGKKPAKLDDFALQKEIRVELDEGIVTLDDLTRFDD